MDRVKSKDRKAKKRSLKRSRRERNMVSWEGVKKSWEGSLSRRER